MSESGDLITRVYTDFRGVDFRGTDVNLSRSPDAMNVWRDYRKTQSISTRPGLSLFRSFGDTVYGIFSYGNERIVHAGIFLYRIRDGLTEKLYDGLAERRSLSFVYENVFYFKDGKTYLRYDGENVQPVEGYIPTTTIARKPEGGGTKHEDVNMLSDYRINTFLADGTSVDYYLDAMGIADDFVPIVSVNGVDLAQSGYTVDYEAGKITFSKAPAAPDTDGQDNVSVKFKKPYIDGRNKILSCTQLQVFDNRVFFSGNPDYPNYIWHCSLDDPSYCSDLDYYRDGMDTSPIRGLVAGNNALWVFREPSDANTTIFYHTPTIDEEFGKIYPSVHSSVTVGCTGAAINFGDDIVFFSDRGMEGISGDVTTEQAAAHRSTLIDRKLTAEAGYRDMILEEWEGYLLCIIGSHIYLADSRGVLTNENHIEYEWFYWETDETVTCTRVIDGVLYCGTENGVYTLDDDTKDIRSYWTTPADRFQNPHKLKTTNKRGCVAEAGGDITVSVKVEDTDFESVGSFYAVDDYFVSRIKRKKFKDIQLKFESDTRFSLESVTLECFVGGYIKR